MVGLTKHGGIDLAFSCVLLLCNIIMQIMFIQILFSSSFLGSPFSSQAGFSWLFSWVFHQFSWFFRMFSDPKTGIFRAWKVSAATLWRTRSAHDVKFLDLAEIWLQRGGKTPKKLLEKEVFCVGLMCFGSKSLLFAGIFDFVASSS